MPSAARKILEQALSLPEEDRRLVAETLLDSLSREAAAEIEQAWNEEALRRTGALERGETSVVDGEEAVTALEAKVRLIHSG